MEMQAKVFAQCIFKYLSGQQQKNKYLQYILYFYLLINKVINCSQLIEFIKIIIKLKMSFLQLRQTPHNRDSNKKLVKILHALLEDEDSIPFRKPVPHKALGLDDYKKIVKKPMDLNQVRRTNLQNKYNFLEEALDEIQLCWENCMRYNHMESPVYKQAQSLENKFWALLKQNFFDLYSKEDQQKIRNKNRDDECVKSQPYFGNYQLPLKKKESQNMVDQGESMNQQDQSSKNYSMNDNLNHESQQGSKMQVEENQSEHGNESKQPNSYQQNSQNHNLQMQRQPIEINLFENPTKQMLNQLNEHMRERRDDKQILQQLLQILMNYQQENMTKNQHGQINFNLSNIHLTTFYRICRAVKLQMGEMLEIIE